MAEKNQESDGDEAQRQRSEIEFGLDARALAIAPPIDIQLDASAEQDETQSNGENENERGNSPEDELLVEILRIFLEFEGHLPDHERSQNDEQHDAGPVKEALAHGWQCLLCDYTSW